jgi:heme/copper-type cytochrome/quinol oxidase subunit 2
MGCWYDAAYNWVSDECTDPVTAAVSIAVNGGAAVITEDVSGEDEALNWMETVFGALIGVVVIAVVLLAVLVAKRRRKRMGKEAETEMGGVVTIVEAAVTPQAIVEAECVDTVGTETM